MAPHVQPTGTRPHHTPGVDRPKPIAGLPFRLGDYEVLEEIGRGGMGVVYRAIQVSLNRSVAVKILPFAALLDGRQLDRFRNEARAAAMLKHPHIVSVLSVGYEHGLHFYAMELVEGCSLAEVIRATSRSEIDRTSLSETAPFAALSTARSFDRQAFFRRVAQLGVQAAGALQVAHEAGIIHRDIKPSNLLLDRDGRLLIADFGLARVQSDKSLTMTGDIVGTLRYMCPEQLQESHVVDQRTDIYSLGVTLRELMTGQTTFASPVRANVITSIIHGDVPKLRNVVKDVPRDLETVIETAISPNPAGRYASAKALEQDLIRFLEGRPVLARRPGSIELLSRWCKRHPSTAVLGALVLVITLAAAIGGPYLAWKQKQLADEQAAISTRQRHEAYDAEMARAHQHVRDGEIESAAYLLSRWIPQKLTDVDHRNF
ncbi:MAG: serine/threonine-protein kinase [Pirellulaceae bacterium]